MTDITEETQTTRRARHEAILAEVAQEEAEAAEAEIAEKASTLDIPLHLRIDRELDEQLRRRAAAEHIPTSALVLRLLRGPYTRTAPPDSPQSRSRTSPGKDSTALTRRTTHRLSAPAAVTVVD